MKKFRIAIAIALVFSLFASFAAVSAAEPTEAEILAKKSEIVEFSEQGNNTFYYMYLDRADMTFKEMTWNSGGWAGPGTPGYEYVMINPSGEGGAIHPADSADGAYAFKCEYSGKIKMGFNAFIPSLLQSDGTGLTVYKNDASTKVWPADADYVKSTTEGTDYEIEIDVKAGDMIYLAVYKLETIASDMTYFNTKPYYQYLSLATESEDNNQEQEDTKPNPDTADFAAAVVVCAVVSAGIVLTVAKKKNR